jgi:diguanylate cyclase (GGDEF)-like protein
LATVRALAPLLLVTLCAFPQPVRAGPDPSEPTPAVVRDGPPPRPAEPDRWLPLRVFPWQDDLQPIATSLTIDAKGYLWAGTPKGPVRYNGRTWRAFQIPHDGPPVAVWPIVPAEDGSVWFGTDDRGVLRWQAGHWQHFDRDSGITDDRVRLLVETRQDGRATLWAGTDQGLSRCTAAGCTPIEQLRGLSVRTVLPTRSENGRPALWVGTRRGLLRLEDLDAPQPAISSILFDARNGLADSSVRSLAETISHDGTTSLWVGTDHGLSRLHGGAWTRYDTSCGFPDAGVITLAPGHTAHGDVVLWAGTFRAGLALIEDDGSWRLFDSRSGLPANFIYSLLAVNDRGSAEPALWMATAGGVARLDREHWRAIDSRDGLPHNTVFGVGEATFPGGLRRYWAGTLGGLVLLGPNGWERYAPDPSLEPTVVKQILNTTEPDGSPGIWMVAVGSLRHFAHGHWQVITSRGGRLASNNILSILAVPSRGHDTIWIGTGAGLVRIEDGRWTTYQQADGLPGKEAKCLLSTTARDGTAAIWAGTDKGLARFAGGRWELAPVPCQPDPMITALQVTAAPGGASWLWIGTRDGVARIQIQGESTLPGTCEAAAPRSEAGARSVTQIQSDLEGRVYFFTEAGVVRLAPRDGTPLDATPQELFSLDDGLPGTFFSEGAFRDRLGRLWAGSTGGVAVLDPAPPPPAEVLERPDPLYLERIRVDRHQRDLPPGTVLRHNENSLELEYALLSFRREHVIRYRTQLAGLETEPSPWTREAREVYTRLPPGDYTFRVWGRNADGVVSGPVEASFRILRAPWLTLWAIALYAIALMGLGYGINLLRLRNVARRAAELEALISERTRELAEANRKLEQASLTDPLTGLNNRRFVALNIESDLRMAERNHQGRPAKERNRDLLLYLLDIDRFKEFNDWAGHPAGDQVLVELAHRLREVARASDAVMRWGGEEFLLISRWTERAAGDVLAARILDAVGGNPFVYAAGRQATVTCSLGWAPYPWRPEAPEAASFEQVLNIADRALYLAKREGRDRAVGVHPGPVDVPPIAEEGLLEELEGTLVELTRVVRKGSREIPRPSWVTA